jgi:hypothetical protein
MMAWLELAIANSGLSKRRQPRSLLEKRKSVNGLLQMMRRDRTCLWKGFGENWPKVKRAPVLHSSSGHSTSWPELVFERSPQGPTHRSATHRLCSEHCIRDREGL